MILPQNMQLEEIFMLEIPLLELKDELDLKLPASLIIIKAHHLLEKHNLTKWQQNLQGAIGKLVRNVIARRSIFR